MQYTPDFAGISAYLRESPELRTELHRRAELGLTVARALAPVQKAPTHDRVPGTLKASGHVEDGDITEAAKQDRMVVNVVFGPEEGYGAAATFPHRHRNPNAADYLRAAIPIIEKG